MANFQKIKGRTTLGTPPSEREVPSNLKAPETAPVGESEAHLAEIDGRTLRATGRTEPFATRVTPGVRKKYKMVATRDDVTMGKLLELALDAYEKLQEG